MANIKTIASDIMRETGYNPPSTFVGNNAQDARRMVAIVNRAGIQLARIPWQRQIRNVTVSVSATSLYALPSDYYQFISNTGWESTRPLMGPVTNQEWQYFDNAVASTGIYYRFRIFVQITGSGPVQRLNIDPALSTSATAVSFVLNYHTDHWVYDSSATTTTAWSSENQDTSIDTDLLSLAVKWRWLKVKGLEYRADFEEYRRALNRERAREGGQGSKLRLDSHYAIDTPNIPDTNVGL